MKTCLAVLALALGASPAHYAAETEQYLRLEGQSLQHAIEALGPPRGTIAITGSTIARFDTCTIVFRHGVAEAIRLHPPTERENASEMQARVDSELEQVGDRLLARYRASGEVESLPPERQVAYWLDFQRKYPQTDVSAELENARWQLQIETEAQERAFNQAERQLAHQQIQDLQVAADELRRAARLSRSGYGYGHAFGHRPYRWKGRPPLAERQPASVEYSDRKHQGVAPMRGADEVLRSPSPIAPMKRFRDDR